MPLKYHSTQYDETTLRHIIIVNIILVRIRVDSVSMIAFLCTSLKQPERRNFRLFLSSVFLVIYICDRYQKDNHISGGFSLFGGCNIDSLLVFIIGHYLIKNNVGKVHLRISGPPNGHSFQEAVYQAQSHKLYFSAA